MYYHKYLKYKQKYLAAKKKFQANMVGGVLNTKKCVAGFRGHCTNVGNCDNNSSYFLIGNLGQCDESTVFTQQDLNMIMRTLVDKILPCVQVNGQNLNNIGKNITAIDAGSFSLILNIDNLIVRVSKLTDNDIVGSCLKEIASLEKIKSMHVADKDYIATYHGFLTTNRNFNRGNIRVGNIQSLLNIVQSLVGNIYTLPNKVQSLVGNIQTLLNKVQSLVGNIHTFPIKV